MIYVSDINGNLRLLDETQATNQTSPVPGTQNLGSASGEQFLRAVNNSIASETGEDAAVFLEPAPQDLLPNIIPTDLVDAAAAYAAIAEATGAGIETTLSDASKSTAQTVTSLLTGTIVSIPDTESSEVISATTTNDTSLFLEHSLQNGPPLEGNVTLTIGAAAGSVAYRPLASDQGIQAKDRHQDSEDSDVRVQPIGKAMAFERNPNDDSHNVMLAPSPSAEIYRRGGAAVNQQPAAALAKDTMTSPAISLNENASVAEAWELFKERRFRHVPVLSDDGRLVGIVSDRDFFSHPSADRTRFHGETVENIGNTSSEKMVAARAETKPANVETKPVSAETKLRDVMTSNVLVGRPETEIRLIAEVLVEQHIGSMPIIDESGTVVGLITRSDILRRILGDGYI